VLLYADGAVFCFFATERRRRRRYMPYHEKTREEFFVFFGISHLPSLADVKILDGFESDPADQNV
jgi:hypothetical protein